MEVTLSYVLTTYNKLMYLKCTLPALIDNCGADEEIIVVDGNSSDGTKEYLQKLFTEKKIHRFISEPDKGEAHGFNKAFLMAKGKLIKIITDDDVYDYDNIRRCKEEMLAHDETDVIAANVLQYYVSNKANPEITFSHTIEEEFKKWRAKKVKNCFFCGLTLMIRKSSLPLVGFFNPFFKMVDIEYAARISSIGANIKFCVQPQCVAIVNDSSNSNKFISHYEKETVKVAVTYEHFAAYMRNYYFYNPFSYREIVRFLMHKLKLSLKKQEKQNEPEHFKISDSPGDNLDFPGVFNNCKKFIEHYNKTNKQLYFI